LGVEVDELVPVAGVPHLHLGGGAGQVHGVAVDLPPAEELPEGGASFDDKVVFPAVMLDLIVANWSGYKNSGTMFYRVRLYGCEP
jgi:hypothetical protein